MKNKTLLAIALVGLLPFTALASDKHYFIKWNNTTMLLSK